MQILAHADLLGAHQHTAVIKDHAFKQISEPKYAQNALVFEKNAKLWGLCSQTPEIPPSATVGLLLQNVPILSPITVNSD